MSPLYGQENNNLQVLRAKKILSLSIPNKRVTVGTVYAVNLSFTIIII